MKNFAEIVESWACCYRPISHDPTQEGMRGARFFMHDSQEQMKGIVDALTQANKTDLFVSVITGHQGEVVSLSEKSYQPGFIAWKRFVLFWSRQEVNNMRGLNALDEYAALRAKTRAVQTAEDFLAFYATLSDPRRGDMPELSGWEYEDVHLVTLPGQYNGWWVCSLSFIQFEPRPKCIEGELYDMSAINQYFPKAARFINHR